MTCIVGIARDGVVYMGADGAGADAAYNLTMRRDPKLFQNGPALIGYTTSFRMGQLLQHAFTVPTFGGGDLFRYMVVDFVDAVRASLKAGGYAKKENEREEAGVFLVGIAGRIFQIFGDYQVQESADGCDACGCGAEVARGSLHSTAGFMPDEPRKRVELALQAAEACSIGVRGPFMQLDVTA